MKIGSTNSFAFLPAEPSPLSARVSVEKRPSKKSSKIEDIYFLRFIAFAFEDAGDGINSKESTNDVLNPRNSRRNSEKNMTKKLQYKNEEVALKQYNELKILNDHNAKLRREMNKSSDVELYKQIKKKKCKPSIMSGQKPDTK